MKKLSLFLMLVLLWTALVPCCALSEGAAVTPGEATAAPTIAPTAAPENTPAPEAGVATVGSMDAITIERKKTMTLAIPVAFRSGSSYWYSNMLESGSIVKYDPTRSAIGYSGDIFSALKSLSVEIDQQGDTPFYPQTIGSRRYIVATLDDSTAKQLGFEKAQQNGQTVYVDPLNGKGYAAGTKYNAGFAVFEGLVVHTNVRNGAYDIPVKIRWESELYGSGSASVVLQATAENSDVSDTAGTTGGGGGTYYFGGGGAEKNAPEAKLIVQGVSTNPENPVAGDEFDLILKLHNTSLTDAVGNITLNCEAENDAILPVSGAFSAYIDTIGANKAIEQRIRVRAQSDIEDEPVKIYVMLDYEDPDATAHSVSQTVVINVSQLMRIRLDEPVLPTDASVAGESYPVSMGVFNLGRTTLYNVTVTGTSDDDNINVGASFYCGNMESGTSKTAEVRFTPLEPGSYSVDLQVTYENNRGESFTETRTVSFYSESYEEEDWFSDLEQEEPEETPEPGPARKALEIAAILPWWVYAFVGGVFMLVVVCIGVSARHRRIRAFENDEME